MRMRDRYGKFIKYDKEYIKSLDRISCKFKGCEKRLGLSEQLFGDYCYHHSVILNQAMYKAILLKYDYQSGYWIEQRKIPITQAQYIEWFNKRDTPEVRNFNPFYRYDMFVEGTLSFSIYTINTSLFD